jgi:hypothetical protein
MPLDLSAGDLARIETGALLLHSAALVGCVEESLTATRDHALNRCRDRTRSTAEARRSSAISSRSGSSACRVQPDLDQA